MCRQSAAARAATRSCTLGAECAECGTPSSCLRCRPPPPPPPHARTRMHACFLCRAGSDVPVAAPKAAGAPAAAPPPAAAAVGGAGMGPGAGATPAAAPAPRQDGYGAEEGECHFVAALHVGVDGAYEVPSPGSSGGDKGVWGSQVGVVVNPQWQVAQCTRRCRVCGGAAHGCLGYAEFGAPGRGIGFVRDRSLCLTLRCTLHGNVGRRRCGSMCGWGGWGCIGAVGCCGRAVHPLPLHALRCV